MKVKAIILAMAMLVEGCGPQTPAEKKIEQGEGPNVEVPAPQPKVCSDYADFQEILADDMQGKLSKADKESLDPNNDGKLCNEPGTEWKDTRTHVEGLPPFEVAFVSDYPVKGIEAGEITIDLARAEKMSGPLLTAVAEQAVQEVGPGTETNYRASLITFRDTRTYEETDHLGIYVADQEAARRMNEHVRQQGWKIDFFTGEVPQGGYVRVYNF